MTNMTSSVLLLSDECHEETTIMSSHSWRSMVIAELKALKLTLAYSLESSLEAQKIDRYAYFRRKISSILSPLG